MSVLPPMSGLGSENPIRITLLTLAVFCQGFFMPRFYTLDILFLLMLLTQVVAWIFRANISGQGQPLATFLPQ